MGKTALITGITGQDGCFLAELLLDKGYSVHGIKRPASSRHPERINHLDHGAHGQNPKLFLHNGDLTDSTSITRIVYDVQPDELYNLAAQTNVPVSFQAPEYTANVNALGSIRLLETLRVLGLAEKTRFFQASTHELFGLVQEIPQRETTPFYPRSPFAAAKLYAYWVTVNYREAFSMYACNGILFNHESSMRDETFVTRKITRAAARIKLGLQKKLGLGNLDAMRDWGYAGDYAVAVWLIMQQELPDDYIVATGESHSVREFAALAFKTAGINIIWQGKGLHEKGLDQATGNEVIYVDPRCFRPGDADFLQGDAGKAHTKLGWQPKVSFTELVAIMVGKELELAKMDEAGTFLTKPPYDMTE